MASLFVYMNGYSVGELIQGRGGEHRFLYDTAWLAQQESIPLSLSMPLTDKSYRGNVVYNYFENLLPDNQAIRERIQARFGAATSKPFDLLSAIGMDCVGAIQLLSARQNQDVKHITGTALTEHDIAQILRQYKTHPMGMSQDDDFRISIAGAQEKTALLWRDQTWQRPTGVTPTTHIFKLPIGKIEHNGIDLRESVENEWLCLKICQAFGLTVASAEMKTFEDTKALVVTRFDRELAADGNWIIRHPIEDMCQAHGISSALKYEKEGHIGIKTIMDLLNGSLTPAEDRFQFMKTMFVFWLLCAIDGHAKNFSVFIKAGGRFHLTPLYDVLSAYPIISARQQEYRNMKMAMALHGKNTHYAHHEIMPRHWFTEAKRVGFSKGDMQTVIESSLASMPKVIDEVAAALPAGFPKMIADSIFEGMRKTGDKMEALSVS